MILYLLLLIPSIYLLRFETAPPPQTVSLTASSQFFLLLPLGPCCITKRSKFQVVFDMWDRICFFYASLQKSNWKLLCCFSFCWHLLCSEKLHSDLRSVQRKYDSIAIGKQHQQSEQGFDFCFWSFTWQLYITHVLNQYYIWYCWQLDDQWINLSRPLWSGT